MVKAFSKLLESYRRPLEVAPRTGFLSLETRGIGGTGRRHLPRQSKELFLPKGQEQVEHQLGVLPESVEEVGESTER